MLTTTKNHFSSSQEAPSPELKIALLIWGEAYEDFLNSIGISLETFCNDIPCGWIIGYIKALKSVRVQTVLIIMSSQVTEPLRFTHTPTNTKVSVLPIPKIYRVIRHYMIHPYPSLANFGNVEDLFGNVRGVRRLLFKFIKQVAPFVSIPLGLFAAELRRENCNAILCQEYEYSRFDVCVLLGNLLQLPVFATFQGGNHDWNRIGRILRPWTLKACTGLVIGTQTEIQRVQKRYQVQQNKIVRIFNPIDLEIWNAIDSKEARSMLNLPDDAQVVVWHGRIDIRNKGLDVLLDAWEQICNERDDNKLWLLLMGTGSDAEQLRQRIAVMLTKNILWLDKYVTDRAEIQCFLSAGDVYAFPSRHEGFAVAPIEAMACGLPVIAAEAPGVPDIFEDGQDSGGLLVPCGDAVAFALALNRLLDNKKLRQEMGKRARSRVERAFSLEVIGKQLRDFLLDSAF